MYLLTILPVVMLHDFRILKDIPGVPSFLLIEVYSAFFYIYLYTNYIKFGFKKHGKSFESVLTFVGGYVLIALTIAVIGYVFNGDVYLAVRVKELLASLAVFYCILLFVRDEISLFKFFRILIISLVALFAVCLSQWQFDFPHFDVIGETAMAKLDFDGTLYEGNQVLGYFNHPNGLATLVLPFVSVTLMASISRAWSLRERIIMFSIFIGCIAMIYLSKSKGILIWMLVSIGMVLFFGFFVRGVNAVMVFIMSLACCVLILLGSLYIADNNLADGLGTIYGRLDQWLGVAELIFANPEVLVIGGGTHLMIYYSSLMSGGGYEYQNAHNYVLNQVLLYGAIGAMLFFGFVFRSVKIVKFSEPLGDKVSSIGAGSIVGFCVMFGAAFFEPLIEGCSLQSVLFGMLALAMVCVGIQNNATQKFKEQLR